MLTMNDNVSKLEDKKRALVDQLQEIEGALDILTDLKANVAKYMTQERAAVPATVPSQPSIVHPPPSVPVSGPVTVQLPAVEEHRDEEEEDDEVELPASILDAVKSAAASSE